MALHTPNVQARMLQSGPHNHSDCDSAFQTLNYSETYG